MHIRPEQPDDFEAIDRVVGDAFESHLKNNAEVRLVSNIRAGAGYVPEFSLVAEDDGEIVGHIMLSYVTLENRNVLQLSPLAVKPERQRQGIGDALSRRALELADERGEPLVLVLGIPLYYPQFGFESARAYGIEPPDDAIPDEPWMVKRLKAYDPSLRGRIDFGPAFDV